MRWIRHFQEPPDPGTLILVRHGETEWNRRELFTGWVDVDLSQRGVVEIEHAARLLMERGYTVDITYTSMLKRAIRSSWIILNEINQIYRPVIKSWRLNERMYGALEGHSKPGLAKVFGKEIVQKWRAGLLDRPPEMNEDHLYWHGREMKYRHLQPSQIPTTESLQDTLDRAVPLWDSCIVPDLKAGRNVMIVAHSNSLRGIVKHIDGIGTDDIQKIGIPNGIPLVYKFDRNLKPIAHKNSQHPLRGIWLEKKGLLKKALDREAELAEEIHGYETISLSKDMKHVKGFYNPTGVSPLVVEPPLPSETISTNNAPLIFPKSAASSPILVSSVPGSGTSPSLIKGLTKLELERKILKHVEEVTSHQENTRVVNKDSAIAFCVAPQEQTASIADIFIDRSVLNSAAYPSMPCDIDKVHGMENGVNCADSRRANGHDPAVLTQLNYIHFFKDVNDPSQGLLKATAPTTTASTEQETPQHIHRPSLRGLRDPVLEQPILVIIRHGKTEHNQLGLFTGWEDALLANEGREEAMHAGKLMRHHEVEFDVVYTSWLSRAIETAWLVLNELDSLWLPIVKTWRLNERMYGALTGLSKKMIRQIYGDEQFMKWRRSFDNPPPPISSFSHAYPGNDPRYVKYVTDVEISIFETLIRSLAHGKLEIHRSFPKRESLKDCMERTIPYFLTTIVPNSIKPGKNVLIASSENAIRGLLMHLCNIPTDKIPLVEIPTGLPLIYDSTIRKIRLLEDGEIGVTINPFEKYNFGKAPELLFDLQGDGTNKDDPEHWRNVMIRHPHSPLNRSAEDNHNKNEIFRNSDI
jgi:2,3-bisphosphoglycerate-dependent phosphoglycerate mutase